MIVLDCCEQRHSGAILQPCYVKCSLAKPQWADSMIGARIPFAPYECYFCVCSTSSTGGEDYDLTRCFYMARDRLKDGNKVMTPPGLGLSTGYKVYDHVCCEKAHYGYFRENIYRHEVGENLRLIEWMEIFL